MRILLTGMSGTGKSTVIRALAELGYAAIDTDYDGWSHWFDTRTGRPASPSTEDESLWQTYDWVWDEERMQALLDSGGEGVLFVAGTAPNQGKFYPRFDHIVLLTAPAAVIVERLTHRTNNPYGTTPRSLARVMDQLQTVEPLLRASAGHVIDTTAPLSAVVARVLRLIEKDPDDEQP